MKLLIRQWIFLALVLLVCTSIFANDNNVVGKWRLTSFLLNGVPVEDDDLGRRVVHFLSDGTMKSYEDGELDEEGKYEIKGNELHMTVDGKDKPDVFKYSRTDGELRLVQKLNEDKELTMVFKIDNKDDE